MKRISIFVLALLLLSSVTAIAFEQAISSGEQTSDSLIVSGKVYITSIKVITNGTNDATLVTYDAKVADGKVIDETKVIGADNYGGLKWLFPIECNDGIYADVTGTGASYIIEYIK